MTILESIILAIVEGLTEFLPVSSTGHMILTEGILGMESTAYLKAFTVMIQFGAILSVVVYYFRRFLPFPILGLKPDPTTSLGGWRLYGLMIVGCIPAAILGALFNETIDTLLGSTWVVLGMLFLGGILMIYFDRIFTNKTERPVQVQNAFIIGLFQCLAMIPGVSRSMATIFGGMQQGLTRRQAAEFSFFLAVPTMFGATLLKGYKLYKELGIEVFQENWQTLLVGNIVAFVVALLAIKFFIEFVTKYGFRVFGYYRILLSVGVAIALLLGANISLS
ncbi:undecaprenyl-diphosphatase UppP [Porphyromonas sp. oral taxon 278 str. W7784]|uniref:undecaprenyl-diphosphatase UppP n=1 Tax=Porphyromonas sp. oral taxon 278 TaxID=712437 RepID=UPI0003ACF106|nr:undecaprenyl-diphosphatase UppP [Porphyromonas sp. oral taxon 278]ERJ72580.1 undecaprenyl-diphosphatase UppP [Porphyromonas sp. oral taxon 278 str. W7784]